MPGHEESATVATLHRRRSTWASAVLGFGLGGFFDGIVFHQVLQWHHLTSTVDAPAFAAIEVQIFFDGLFHLGAYLTILLGLAMLWSGRDALRLPNALRAVMGALILGFGLFHVFDNLAFHWLLGLHHIRLDQPLFWDVVTFTLGLAMAIVGWRLLGSARASCRP